MRRDPLSSAPRSGDEKEDSMRASNRVILILGWAATLVACGGGAASSAETAPSAEPTSGASEAAPSGEVCQLPPEDIVLIVRARSGGFAIEDNTGAAAEAATGEALAAALAERHRIDPDTRTVFVLAATEADDAAAADAVSRARATGFIDVHRCSELRDADIGEEPVDGPEDEAPASYPTGGFRR